MSSPRPDPKQRRRRLIVGVCAVVAVGMVGAAYAAVPFYRAFCQATGFNGTPKRAESGPAASTSTRTITVRFDTNVRDMPWTVMPEVNTQTVRVGRTNLVNFTITNNGDTPMTGRASYNVAPEAAAQYFTKLQCFCFSDQTIPAHTSKTFPVVYFVDAKFASDPDTVPLSELTLSYTMFPSPDGKPGKGSVKAK